MRKRILASIILIIIMGMLCAGTLAYYTVSSKAHNIITTSSVDIAVEEWQNTPAGLKPYPKTPVAVMPGKQVSKIVKIRNLSEESYIRACIEVILTDAAGTRSVLSEEEAAALLHFDMNTKDWAQKANDRRWWYYADPVSEDMATEPLFYEVQFDGKGMDDMFQNSTIEIHVAAQAVQAANNASTAMTATGWPGA